MAKDLGRNYFQNRVKVFYIYFFILAGILESAASSSGALHQLPVDYSTSVTGVTGGVQELTPGVVSVNTGQLESQDMVPLNLATGGEEAGTGKMTCSQMYQD